MSDELGLKNDVDPGFDLRRLGRVPTYEVMEPDLTALETAYARESSAFGWLSGLAGIAVTLVTTTAVSWASMSDVLKGIFFACSVAALMQMGRSWRLWVVAKKEAPVVLNRIRTSYRIVE